MDKILIKNAKEIEIMRKGGRIAASVLKELEKACQPNVSTASLNLLAEKLIHQSDATSSFKNFNGYPASICVSVNEEVVHGIPSEEKILKEGDIVGIDIGVLYQGFHTDTALTCGVGKISARAQQLIDVTKNSLEEAISVAKPGMRLGDIGFTVQEIAESSGFSVVRDLVGHGVGKSLQEPPSIPNYGKKGSGSILKEGMTLAIEPMINQGGYRVGILDDGWTVITADSSLSAHFEHTVAITSGGAEILTKTLDPDTPNIV